MGNVRYRLFDEEFVESQGMMMTRAFETLLNRHLEKVPEAVEALPCLAPVDYRQDLEALRSASSVFLNKQTIQVGAQAVCVGTSCNLPEKERLIFNLLKLCGEDKRQFDILEANAGGSLSRFRRAAGENSHGVYYRLFDKKERSSQADMLYRAVSEILLRKPELTDWAVENLNCVSDTDYTKRENQSNMPSAFRNCRPLEVNGRRVWIARGYGLKQKQHFIDRLLREAGFPKDAFEVYSGAGVPLPFAWQKELVDTVMNRLRPSARDGGLLGLISLPPGCGKSAVLGEISRRQLERGPEKSVLLLTSTAVMAEQYADRLEELLGGFWLVQLAASSQDVEEGSCLPGMVMVSTVQKLLSQKRERTWSRSFGEAPAFSESPHLLVIVEEAASHYSSRTYSDMRCRFPNAAFLGVTVDPAFTRRLEERFGPLLYRYSWADACEDGLLRHFEYREVGFGEAEAALERRYISSFLTERVGEAAKWIAGEENGKDRCALLLCESSGAAMEYYNLLLPLMGSGRLRVCLAPRAPESQNRKARYAGLKNWNGEYFPGLVIASTPSLVRRPFQTVYLDKQVSRFELANICSLLMTNRESHQGPSVLVSFYPMKEKLENLLGMDIEDAAVPSGSHDALERFQETITGLLEEHRYEDVGAELGKMRRFYPQDEERLSAQLEFLFPQDMDQMQRRQYWERRRNKLAWQSDLWRLLSRDSSLEWKGCRIPEPSAVEEAEEEALPDAPAAASKETPQQRGARLEQAVKKLLRLLFELEDDGPLDCLRVQGGGLQFGFDVMLKYRDCRGVLSTSVIECKNYSDDVCLKDVSDKLVARQMANTKVDHWILISPYRKITNELREMAEKWKETDRWYPILDVQFWTPDEGIQELFGLFPELYQNFYNWTEQNNPSQWSGEKRDGIAAHWKSKLAPVPHLPLEWKDYLRKPEYLLTERETDPETARSYAQLYGCRAPMRLTDQDELPIEGLAEEYFFKWLQKPEEPCALLLGDFGDGKSFFTYVLARRLAEEFWVSPAAGWIPLRISLRELGDRHMDSRQVLRNRLNEFCDGIQSWNQVRGRYQFLIILDGLDEMSLGMNDTAVLDNLSALEELIEQFEGYKILVTSRKMVIYSDKVRKRILSALKKPEVLHLAPISRRDCVSFLERQADTPKRKRRLLKIQRTHDLLGLAEKPLFLSMILEQMDDDDIQAGDMFEIYNLYAQKVLARKFRHQLAMQGSYVEKEAFCGNLMNLLEDLAVYMQLTGKDSVSLEEFKEHIHKDSLVRLLWSCIGGTDEEEDANNRISNRSLLKYDRACPENRSFCHRSMKEYFVARGVVRRLCEEKDLVRELLMKSGLGYEICLFAGKALQKLPATHRGPAQKNLTELARETRGMHGHPRRKEFANLGANSVNLLHCGGFGLPGEDWSGLLLDSAALSGACLSGKNFSHCSMRFAHLDNADLTACDLRGCDFTGVQFEKSGRLRTFALDTHENILLACYQDGELRKWQTAGDGTQTAARLEPKKWIRLVVGSEGREGAAFPEGFQFWNRSAKAVRTAGYIAFRKGVRLLDAGSAGVLIRWGREALLLNAGGEVLCRQEVSGSTVYGALLSERAFVMWSAGRLQIVGEAADESCGLDLHDGQVTALCAAEAARNKKLILLGYEDGRVRRFTAAYGEDGGNWTIGPGADLLKCGNRIEDMAAYGAQELYVGTSSGAIIRYAASDRDELELVKTYRLELKCTGARIEGVWPPEQFEILRRAGAL